MVGNRIIVVGASAGGVEALKELVAYLPADLAACILIVLHTPAYSTSMLPNILSRAGNLPAIHPEDKQKLEQGKIFIAPPDKHLLVKNGYVNVVRGPNENGHRPAIDPLFRTAARAYKRNVIGVILSGMLDDGTAGLATIRKDGGVTIVQKPEEAIYSGMPNSAIENVQIDYVLSIAEIAGLLTRLSKEKLEPLEIPVSDTEVYEDEIAEFDMEAIEDPNRPGVPSSFVCPECGGTLWEITEDDILRYRCHVGHAFSVETLRAEQAEALENALWVALRTLEDTAMLSRRLIERSRIHNRDRATEKFEIEAQNAEQSAKIIRDVLLAGIVDSDKESSSQEGIEKQ